MNTHTAEKFVGFAYPSSPRAQYLGHSRFGCYFVAVRSALKGNAVCEEVRMVCHTLTGAQALADTLALPYASDSF